jgi:hypothetical protein
MWRLETGREAYIEALLNCFPAHGLNLGQVSHLRHCVSLFYLSTNSEVARCCGSSSEGARRELTSPRMKV